MAAPTANQPIDAQRSRARLVAAAPPTERREVLAGVSTNIMDGGEGPPMVLLHGHGEYWAVWLTVLSDLVRTHRVIVADLPGHGDSLDIEGKVDTVLRWVDQLIDTTFGVPPIPPDDLVSIAVPTALIHVGQDLQVPVRAAERASERYGWPLHVIDGGRDDPAAEQPDAFIRALPRRPSRSTVPRRTCRVWPPPVRSALAYGEHRDSRKDAS
jgi:pimeloyl-ACP methyl ester carboxylesterase